MVLGIHSTALLDAGIPVHTVAQRIGDDPAILLKNYTKRKRLKQADESCPIQSRAWRLDFLALVDSAAISSRVSKSVSKTE